MSPAAFAWRSLTRQPARAVLGVAGVAAVGALLFDMLLLSRGLVLSFEKLLDSTGFDVRVTATAALPGTGPRLDGVAELTAALRELPEIAEVAPLVWGDCDVVLRERPERDLTLLGAYADAPSTWVVVEGRDLPDPPTEPTVVVNRNLAALSGVSPGDLLKIRARLGDRSALPPVEFRVVGVADFPFNARDSLTAATTLDAFFRARGEEGEDSADLLLVASSPGHGPEDTVEAIRRARPELYPFSNDHLVARFRGTDFSYFRQISLVLTTVTLFFAFLLVTTLLTVAVNQRFGEIAALRAMGFSQRRVVSDLLCESFLLVGAGGLAALPLGLLLARWLDAILRDMPGLPVELHFFVLEPRAVLLHGVLLAIAGILASLYPVYLAARLPIAATLRNETVS
jgi:putative ABC transport system permease protein